jgi:cell wall-associated NlpC family hydrolase
MLVLALAAAACASHSMPSTSRRPSPFPVPNSPVAIAPEVPSGTPAVAADVIRTALSLEGVPYRWGGDEPATGFDCSGFVRYVLTRHRIAAPRTSAEQYRIGSQVGADQIRAGDLVFFSTVAPGASHVGLALNNEEFVHAPASSGVVRVERLRAPYWNTRYVGARRVF